MHATKGSNVNTIATHINKGLRIYKYLWIFSSIYKINFSVHLQKCINKNEHCNDIAKT